MDENASFYSFVFNPHQLFFGALFFIFPPSAAGTVAYSTPISMQRDARRSLISLSNQITGATRRVNHSSRRSVLAALLFVSPRPYRRFVQSI